MAEARKAIKPGPLRRRVLHFDNLSQVLDDVCKMHACAHRSAGHWTLAQVYKHLANTFHGSIDGLLLGGHRLRRLLFGRRILAWTLKHGIPPGVTLDPRLNPPADCDFDTSFVELERSVAKYSAYRGRLKPHPVFGRLNRASWDRLHCFHCAHHLSFIVPDES